ncbi:MAG: succinyl-diaminopimelate desuccinylase [Candidatus Midichloriaceae bacterium]|jgi:succinyl-diaminopimelate desuccinylase|nr:succinyl-diaminopimelate desuccinylase [Candidatus Midichloriaceae bacterium]
MDSIAIAQKLISCKSITPGDDGIFDYVLELLATAGFKCQILEFGEGKEKVKNLYAQVGVSAPNLCFAGHLDVVPPGDLHAWKHNPFAGTIEEGKLFGRGAVDMKCAVAAWIAASIKVVNEGKLNGSISLLLTGDEEGPATHGTVKVLEHLKEQGVAIDACIVGEPTCEKHFGDTIKIGRRGSITYNLEVIGVQGHVAYPHLAKNPIDIMVAILHELKAIKLDVGNENFQASNLEIISVDVGNSTTNTIPGKASAILNVRYNNEQTEEKLTHIIKSVCDKHTDSYHLTSKESAKAFLSAPNDFAYKLAKVVEEVSGIKPKFSTSGGTSDARFIQKYCQVAEFGLLNDTAHKVDEYTSIENLVKLEKIYYNLIFSSTC